MDEEFVHIAESNTTMNEQAKKLAAEIAALVGVSPDEMNSQKVKNQLYILAQKIAPYIIEPYTVDCCIGLLTKPDQITGYISELELKVQELESKVQALTAEKQPEQENKNDSSKPEPSV